MLGPLGTYVVLRSDVSDDPTVHNLIDQVESLRKLALQHVIPLSAVVNHIKPKVAPGTLPIGQVALSVVPPREGMLADAASAFDSSMCAETALFDLSVDLVEGPESLSGYATYRSDLFSEATIATMVRYLERALASLVTSAEALAGPVHGIRMTTAEEEAFEEARCH